MIDIDIIIPVFNSEKSCKSLIDKLNELNDKNYFNLNLFFINDGSNDNSHEELVQQLNHASFKYKYIKLAKNYGQYTATAVGFYYCQSSLIATLDDDLQHDPLELIDLHKLLVLENADLIYGKFEDKKHYLLRNFGTKILQKLLGFESDKYKMITSFRLLKENVISTFKQKLTKNYFIDDYLILASGKVLNCHVKHHNRANGKSGYSFKKLVSMAFLIFFLHSSLSLKLISRMGVFLSLVFFIIGGYYIVQKIFYDVEIGFTSLIVSIFFSTGLILFSLGIIGEYIRQIWVSNQSLDRVIITESCNN